MTLIEFLISENKKGWEWPDSIVKATSTKGGRGVNFYFDYACPPSLSNTLIAPTPFSSSELVTRDKYEAALAASKPEWDGAGLPTVGCECEYETNGYGIKKVRVECITMDGIAFTWLGEDPRFRGLDCINTSQAHRFRPIRSEADKKKEAVEKAIADALLKDGDFDHEEALRLSTFVYGAISRNEIPHIRID